MGRGSQRVDGRDDPGADVADHVGQTRELGEVLAAAELWTAGFVSPTDEPVAGSAEVSSSRIAA